MARRLNEMALVGRPVRRHAERIAGEYLIDGCLLQEHVERAAKRRLDLVSPVGWTTQDYQRQYAQRLLLQTGAVLPSGRREVLVCPECADLACGCLSVEITIGEGRVIWSRLGYENNYDPESLNLLGIGSFVFAMQQYESLLKGLSGA
jgi:hypothetical protein